MSEDELKYENNENFNIFLDEEGDIVIVGTSFKRSFILYNLDPILYNEALLEFKTRRLEDLKQVIYDEFPACIAYNYRLSNKGEGSFDPVKKLLHLKDTWESVIFVLYALVLGEIRKKNLTISRIQIQQGQGFRKFNSNAIFTDSLKIKIENIRGIIEFCYNNSISLKSSKFIDNETLNIISSLQDIRNDISHHSTPTREQADIELKQISPLLESLLPRIEFLRDCKINRFSKHEQNTSFETFNGYSLNREFDHLNLSSSDLAYILSNQDDLFAFWEDEIISLSPFMHYIPDETGHESFLCFFKGRKHGNFHFEPIKKRKEVTFPALIQKFEREKEILHQLMVP